VQIVIHEIDFVFLGLIEFLILLLAIGVILYAYTVKDTDN
jgi:hypothetical protein